MTATSFGPTKQNSLLKNPHGGGKEVAVNTNDYTEVDATSVKPTSAISKEQQMIQGTHFIDAASTSEEGKSTSPHRAIGYAGDMKNKTRQFNLAGSGTVELSDYVNS